MYKETWEFEDGRMLNIVFREGHLEENVTRDIKPYFNNIVEEWIFPIPHTNGLPVTADSPDDVIIYKALNSNKGERDEWNTRMATNNE